MFNDKTLSCKDCGEDFVFSASEQEFYEKKGFKNEPRRCKDCRDKMKKRNQERRSKGGNNRSNKPMFTVTCSACNKTTTVPFQPTGDKPVYCRECFQARR